MGLGLGLGLGSGLGLGLRLGLGLGLELGLGLGLGFGLGLVCLRRASCLRRAWLSMRRCRRNLPKTRVMTLRKEHLVRGRVRQWG